MEATNMFSLLDGDNEGSTIIDTAMSVINQKKLKEQEKKEQLILMEKERELDEQKEKERKQQELRNRVKEALPFNFRRHNPRPSYRRKQDQNGDSAKSNGDQGSTKSSQKDHGEESSTVSEKDQSSTITESSNGANQLNDDKKDNDGAEESKDPPPPGKNAKKSKLKKARKQKRQAEADSKSARIYDEKKEGYSNLMTLEEYEKLKLEKKNASESDKKSTEDDKQVTSDKVSEPSGHGQEKLNERSFAGRDGNEVQQHGGQRPNGYEGERPYRRESWRPKANPNGQRYYGERTNNNLQFHGGDGKKPYGRGESKGPNGDQGERPSFGPRDEGRNPNYRGESKGPNGDQGGRHESGRPIANPNGQMYSRERPNSFQGHGGDGKQSYGRGESRRPNGDQGERPSFRRGAGRNPNYRGQSKGPNGDQGEWPSARYGRNGPHAPPAPAFQDTNQFPALGAGSSNRIVFGSCSPTAISLTPSS